MFEAEKIPMHCKQNVKLACSFCSNSVVKPYKATKYFAKNVKYRMQKIVKKRAFYAQERKENTVKQKCNQTQILYKICWK